jgi:hypothetical protein
MSIVTVITPDALEGNGKIAGSVLDWSDYDRHYLAEGDSWFSLSDLFSASFLYRFGRSVPLRKNTLIVNCSYPGDTLAKMVDWTNNDDVPRLLNRAGFCWQWDALLLSAGGNDVIEAALSPAGILHSCASPTSHEDFIDRKALDALESHLRQYFLYMVALRNTSAMPENRNIPIYFHTNGYPTVRDAPALMGVMGPRLYRAFRDQEIPVHYWQDLSNTLMEALAGMLRSFTQLDSNLGLVDTLAKVALTPALPGTSGNNGDWLNEIHLNNSGKDKVASYWATFL